jgi:DNA-directed RNA polymerase subunit RPC12/RpoP
MEDCADDFCPLCGDKLTPETVEEYRGECFGFPAWELMTEYVCHSCGWTDQGGA